MRVTRLFHLRQIWAQFALASVLLMIPAWASSPRQLLASGHADEAIANLQQQIDRSPDAESYILLCRAYFMIEDWDSAINACQHARDLDPQQSAYYLWLGRAYGEKADRAGFISALELAKKLRVAFERAVELDPGNWEARTDLAEFYVEAPGLIGGGKDKAHEQADFLRGLNPTMAHWVLARIAERDNDPATAEREYRAEIAASHYFPVSRQSTGRDAAGLAAAGVRPDRSSRIVDGCRQPSLTGREKLSAGNAPSPPLFGFACGAGPRVSRS